MFKFFTEWDTNYNDNRNNFNDNVLHLKYAFDFMFVVVPFHCYLIS